MVIDLRTALPRLLPRAVAWAEPQANILASGFPLSPEQITAARTVGVSYPQNIGIRLVNRLPLPDDPSLPRQYFRQGSSDQT
jgi:hypothetical protein